MSYQSIIYIYSALLIQGNSDLGKSWLINEICKESNINLVNIETKNKLSYLFR